nr:unnamed protein product [Callosobruchus analis]
MKQLYFLVIRFVHDDENHKDVSVQTYIFARIKSTQTLAEFSAKTTEQRLRKEFEALKRAAAPPISSAKKQKCETQEETGITIEDIHKYLEQSLYSKQACKSLRIQLNLLKKSPKGCRLPSETTLKRFLRTWMIHRGFNGFIFGLLELRAKMFSEKERDCIISLDEVGLQPHLFYNISNDKIVGQNSTKLATKALVVMARGIASDWKQPIVYFFYNASAHLENIKDILFESVRKLTAVRYNVVGVVSDQRPNFRKIVKNVLIKLFYLFDVLHLLESTRNNFMSYNFWLPEGTVKKCYLDAFYAHDKKKEYITLTLLQARKRKSNFWKKLYLRARKLRGKTDRMHFIYGWKLTINSIKALWDSLKTRQYSVLLTGNLNLDCMEIFSDKSEILVTRQDIQLQNCFPGHLKNYLPLNTPINLVNITPELLETCKTIPDPIASSPLKVFTSNYRNISYIYQWQRAGLHHSLFSLKKFVTTHVCLMFKLY